MTPPSDAHGHDPSGGLSHEARAFLADRTDDGPVDFSRIDAIRQEAHDGFQPAVQRAIERHDLRWEDIELGGIRCTRLRSSRVAAEGTLFYCFGGGFFLGDPISEFPVIGALAEWARVEVIAPWYRLAPEYPAPAAGDDCFAAWAALAAGGGRLFIGGESAGGNLALATAQRGRDAGLPHAAALALLSPAVDLRTDPALFGVTLGADPTLAHHVMTSAHDVYVAGRDPTDPAISPLFGSMTGLPPTMITTGTRDLLLSMCLRLDRRLRRSGVPVETHVWDGLWHVFEFYDDYPESRESLSELAAFLTRH